jgi:hypothetical protein
MLTAPNTSTTLRLIPWNTFNSSSALGRRACLPGWPG